MKKIILTAIVLGGLCATFFLINQKAPVPSPEQPDTESRVTETTAIIESPKSISGSRIRQRAVSGDANPSSNVSQNEGQPLPGAQKSEEALLQQTLENLTSLKTGFDQKQALWKRLRDEGKLDETIAELEKRATNNPTAEIPATLGYAYIQKIQVSEDQRDQAVLAMKADKSFDEALKLDPANWEAQFYKTSSMTYWPEQMKKGPEIVQRFTDLIKQQEAMPTEPQFAKTYELLGQQYKKSGQLDHAKQVWERGIFLFPEDQTLKKKLATAP